MMAAPASRESYPTTNWRWGICYWIAVIGVFAWAGWQRFSLPLDPIVDPDFWGYLSPALRKLTGGDFGHTQARNFVYPGFLYLLLRAWGDFRVIPIVQHLLGLTAGAVFLFTWRRLRIFVPHSVIRSPLHDVLGLAGATVYLSATETILTEGRLRPEAVCGFVIGVNLYFAARFVGCFMLENRRTSTVVYGTATVLTSLLLASVRPNFWFTLIVTMLPVGIFFVRQGWWPQKIALAAASMLSAIVVLWPEHILSQRDEESRTFLPTMLFVIHADLIRDQMAADLKEGAIGHYSREWLEHIYSELKSEIAKSQTKYPGHYPSLGFDPEYLWFDQTSIVNQLHREFGKDVSGLCEFYRFYYWHTWQGRPLAALRKVARQFSIYYYPRCLAYTPMKIWPLSDEYKKVVGVIDFPAYRRMSSSLRAAGDFAQRATSLAQNASTVEQPRPIRVGLRLLAVTLLPSLCVTVVLSAIIFWKQSPWRHLRALATVALFAFAYAGAGCLEAAIVNSLDVQRYITVGMYGTLLAQFVAVWLILEFVLQVSRHRHSRDADIRVRNFSRGSFRKMI